MLDKIKKIDAAILLFLITGLGYAITYIYGYGVLYYYKIPASLVDINPTNILKNTILIMLLFTFGYINNYLIERNFKSIFIRFKKFNYIVTSKIFQLVIIIGLLYFLYRYLQTNSPTDALIFVAMTLFYAIYKKYKNMAYIFIIIFFALLIFTFGYSNGLRETNYYTLANNNFVVIGYYKDSAIVVKFDPKEKIIYPEYQLIKLEAGIDEQKFKLVRTGSLKVAEPYNE